MHFWRVSLLREGLGALEFHVQGQDFPIVLGDGGQLPGKLLGKPLVPGDAQQGGARAGQAEGRARASIFS